MRYVLPRRPVSTAFLMSMILCGCSGLGSQVVMTKPILKMPLSAKYPSVSLNLGEEGTAIVQVHVLKDGSVADSVIVVSSGYGRLDEAALESTRSARFIPGMNFDGRTVSTHIEIPVNFEISRTADKAYSDMLTGQVKERIDKFVPASRGASVVVELRAESSGRLCGFRVVNSSGDARWNKAVIEAIESFDSIPKYSTGAAPGKATLKITND
ncbi:MAG: C-terminal TonB domain conaining protein [Comamonadaceae bacterium]|nr:MAG: C-terminal TonB domain conaining protein [Comamonadaceae bacterium]